MRNVMTKDAYLPQTAQIIQRRAETKDIFTLGLKFTDEAFHQNFQFQPGQFNMLYLYGVGKSPFQSPPIRRKKIYISIQSVESVK